MNTHQKRKIPKKKWTKLSDTVHKADACSICFDNFQKNKYFPQNNFELNSLIIVVDFFKRSIEFSIARSYFIQQKTVCPYLFQNINKTDSQIKFYLIYINKIARYLTARKTFRPFRFPHFISFLRICASIICQLHLPCFLPLGNNRIVMLQILLKHEKYFPCVGGKITLNMIYDYMLHK